MKKELSLGVVGFILIGMAARADVTNQIRMAIPMDSGDGGFQLEEGSFSPNEVATDSEGNVVIASPHAHLIRVVCARTQGICAGLTDGQQLFAGAQEGGNQPILPGHIYRLAGMPHYGFGSGVDCAGSAEGAPAQSSCLNFPASVVVDAWDNVIIADTHNSRIRIVCMNPRTGDPLCEESEPGRIHTIAEVERPAKIELDEAGNLLVSPENPGSANPREIFCVEPTRGECSRIVNAVQGQIYPLAENL